MAEYERDERGRITRRTGAVPGAGRPSLAAQERLRIAIEELMDAETLEAWQESMRKKLRKGNTAASNFVRDTVLGKPSVQVQADVSPELLAFMEGWRNLGGGKDDTVITDDER